MLRKSKFWRISAISFLNILFGLGLAPALGADCGLYGCGAGVAFQQGYPVVGARYCDGYGGGQWPYGSCSIGRAGYVAPLLVPAPGPAPIVTKHRADGNHIY
jgi:hypothetical protein